MCTSEQACLDKRSDDAQTGEPQVLEGTGFGDGVKEGVEEERNVRCAEQRVSKAG